MTTAAVETFRIGEGGLYGQKFTATSPDERVALIDRYLGEHRDAVMFLEVKRGEQAWEEWQNDRREVEFMRVGVNGAFAAAEYVRHGARAARVIRATHNPAPTGTEPRVLYDDCVPQYFPPNTVLPVGEVRRLMVDFALTGRWSEAVSWENRDHLVV